MMKTLFLSSLLFASVAYADAPNLQKDPAGYAKHWLTYWEGRVNELGLPAKIDLDEKSAGKIDETRAVRVKLVAMGLEDGLGYFLQKAEYKPILIANVRSIRIVHDDALGERDFPVTTAGGVLTARVNLSKFVSSNVGPTWADRVHWGMPALVEHYRAAGLKSAAADLSALEESAAKDTPARKMKMSVRWQDAKGTADWEHGNGDLFRHVGNLMRNLDFAVANSKGAKRIHKLTIGIDQKKDAAPKFVVKGDELLVIVAYETARSPSWSIDWKQEIARTFK